jgi:hypothetical protein
MQMFRRVTLTINPHSLDRLLEGAGSAERPYWIFAVI